MGHTFGLDPREFLAASLSDQMILTAAFAAVQRAKAKEGKGG